MALSVERVLNAAFAEEQPIAGSTARAAVVASDDFKKPASSSRIPRIGVSIFAFRVEPNRALRSAVGGVSTREGRGFLPLDLHLLLTAWAATPEGELEVLGRAMQALEETPILSGPLLEGSGAWDTGEAVQLVLGEASPEELARAFETLAIEYRLSVPYLARVIRIGTAGPGPVEVKTAEAHVIPSGRA